MTDAINNNSALNLVDMINDINLGPNDSVQMRFAALQLAQSMLCKSAAQDYMDQIEQIQALQKKCSEMIAKARDLQNQAKKDDTTTTMPQDMIDFFEENHLHWDEKGDDYNHNKDEWDYNIQSLTNFQESISNKTQTLMVYLQDYIGQYNSFTQGASAQVSQAMQTLTAVATGR